MNLKYLHNVTTLKLDQEKCTGCGLCIQVCPHEVYRIDHGKAKIVDLDSCMECGACSQNCAFNAISVKAGVGCASALLISKIKGKPVECGCSDSCCG